MRPVRRNRGEWLKPSPVSAYVNELADAGFYITRMVEVHDESNEGDVPGLMYLRADSSPLGREAT